MTFRCLLMAIIIATLVGCTQNVRPISEQDQKLFSTTEIYFATNRVDTANANLNRRYNSDRGPLTYGVSTIAIPVDYAKSQTTPFLYWNMTLRRNPVKHLATLAMAATNADDFFAQLNQDEKKRNALVFIHGFNTPFERANRIAAKMHYDLSWPGPIILFSWPSHGTATSYPADEANLRWSQQDLETLLTALIEQTNLRLNLMAHSLGNRALTDVLIKLLDKHPQWQTRINAVILAAPDIDAGYFERTVGPALVRNNLPVTLYVSANDIALLASKKIHRNPRAGDSSDTVVIVPGVTTIDASLADSEIFGHEYYYQGPDTIADLYQWLVLGRPVSERPQLQPRDVPGGRYWQLTPIEPSSP